MKIVVTGAARSGTGYMSKLLDSAGVPCGHEDIFCCDGLEGARANMAAHAELAAASSWLGAPFLGSDLLRDAHIVHLVRHPLDCIESLLSVGALRNEPWAGFMRQHLPGLARFEDEADAAAYYWIYWNRMIEPWAQVRYQVEDECPERLLAWLGIQHQGPLFGDRRYNHRPGYPLVSLSPKRLQRGLRRDLQEMATRYRYELE